jgi:cytochrome c biogenesis protein CcmG/thiol:disulfide interchange protein DsbE
VVRCEVLEVRYDDYYESVRHISGPVRYWVDPGAQRIWRMEFHEVDEQESLAWSVAVESMRLGGPAPSWFARQFPVEHLTGWIGKQAPDFELQRASGGTVRLSDLRGKVVLLDFWATWCVACEEEIPILEQLQKDPAMSDAVVLGVTDEEPEVAQEWLTKYRREFKTLVGAKKTFEEYGAQAVPLLVLIDSEGIIREYVLSFCSDRRLRAMLGPYAEHVAVPAK